MRAARIARRKSSCVCFQDLEEDLSSGDRRFFSCLGKNSASSVPWILCLAESNGFLFLFADRSQILACFSNDWGINVRAHIAHGRRMGGTSVSIYQELVGCCDPPVRHPHEMRPYTEQSESERTKRGTRHRWTDIIDAYERTIPPSIHVQYFWLRLRRTKEEKRVSTRREIILCWTIVNLASFRFVSRKNQKSTRQTPRNSIFILLSRRDQQQHVIISILRPRTCAIAATVANFSRAYRGVARDKEWKRVEIGIERIYFRNR